MGKKTFMAGLITIFFVIALNSSATNAQTTQFYGRGYNGTTSNLNYCSFYITMNSPNDQTTYANTMPLEFNITWTEYPNFPIPALYGYYAYSIDDGPPKEILSNQSANDAFYQTSKNNFTINPSFSYSVDISHLEKGYHNIAINASLYNQNRSPPPIYPPDHLYFNMTTSPYKFLVGEPTSNQKPSSPTTTPKAIMSASLSESASALNFGNKINFTVSVEGGRAPYTYTWNIEQSSDVVLVETSTSPYYSSNTFSPGSHHVYVEVKDADNNTGKTLTVEFNVLPFSSLSPSTSSTQEPTLEPSQSATPTEGPFIDFPISPLEVELGLIVFVLLAFLIAVLVYIKKIRKQK